MSTDQDNECHLIAYQCDFTVFFFLFNKIVASQIILKCFFLFFRLQLSLGDSYEKFQQGECADCSPDGSLCRKLTNFEPALFDHPASNREEILPDFETRFYLNTGDEKPYCGQLVN